MPANKVRVIAGRWRGSRIGFPVTAQLRPSPDRVRETLFNWLQGRLDGARCLDLFAGSGILGLEAVSRGAAVVHWVDSEPVLCRHLNDLCRRFQLQGQGSVYCMDALQFLSRCRESYDMVFLDPPFQGGFMPRLNEFLQPPLVVENSLLYMETHEKQMPQPPAGWVNVKDKTIGSVRAGLWRWAGQQRD